MIKKEEKISIKTLWAHDPEIGTIKIAELLGISMSTVKQVIKEDMKEKQNKEEKINKTIKTGKEFFTMLIF